MVPPGGKTGLFSQADRVSSYGKVVELKSSTEFITASHLNAVALLETCTACTAVTVAILRSIQLQW